MLHQNPWKKEKFQLSYNTLTLYILNPTRFLRKSGSSKKVCRKREVEDYKVFLQIDSMSEKISGCEKFDSKNKRNLNWINYEYSYKGQELWID